MIPYYIQHAYPIDNMRDNNIDTENGCVENEKINETIINSIIEFMNNYCCEETGHNLQITSYIDFCEKFWKNGDYIISGWYFIFNVYYFEDKWIEWDVEKYQDLIYFAYLNKYIKEK